MCARGGLLCLKVLRSAQLLHAPKTVAEVQLLGACCQKLICTAHIATLTRVAGALGSGVHLPLPSGTQHAEET